MINSLSKLSQGKELDIHEFHRIELYVTYFHEVRHFHDSLLNPALYALYGINVSENQLRWLIINEICNNPNLSIQDAIVSAGAEEFECRLKASRKEFEDRFANNFKAVPRKLGNTYYSFSITTFFELSATFQEVASVMGIAGEAAGMRYWEYKKREANPLYTHIFEIFMGIHNGNFHRAYDHAASLFDIALVSPINPMRVFLHSLMDEMPFKNLIPDGGNAVDLCKLMIRHQESLNIEIPLLAESEEWMSTEEMSQIRNSLVDKKVYEFGLRTDKYFESFEDLPLPVIYFFPSDIEYSRDKGRMYQDSWLNQSFGPMYSLLGKSRPDGNYIGAGIIRPSATLGGFKPSTGKTDEVMGFIKKTDDMIFSQWCVGEFFQNGVEAVSSVHAYFVARAKEIGFPFERFRSDTPSSNS